MPVILKIYLTSFSHNIIIHTSIGDSCKLVLSVIKYFLRVFMDGVHLFTNNYTIACKHITVVANI